MHKRHDKIQYTENNNLIKVKTVFCVYQQTPGDRVLKTGFAMSSCNNQRDVTLYYFIFYSTQLSALFRTSVILPYTYIGDITQTYKAQI